MVLRRGRGSKLCMQSLLITLGLLGGLCLSRRAGLGSQDNQKLVAERALAAAVSETRMGETVRRLVAFGPRSYGSPANREAAAWLAGAFREAGLEAKVRQDAPRG